MAMEDHQQAKASAVESSRHLTRTYAASGNALIERTRELMKQATQLSAGQTPGDSACRRMVETLLLPQHHNVSILRPDGSVLCASQPQVDNISRAAEGWFRRALATGAFSVGHFQTDPVTGAGELPLAMPVRGPGGEVRFVLSLGLTLFSLRDVLDDEPLPEGAAASIIDRTGTILARFPDEPAAVGRSAPDAESFLPELVGQGRDTWESVGVDGVRRIYFLSPLSASQDRGLFLRVGMPADVAFAAADRALKRNVGFIGLMCAVVLLATWIFSNRLVLRHTRGLWLATKKLTEGNYSHRIGHQGGGELGELALAFDHMAGVLEDRTARLSSAEIKYREIFENSVAGIFQATPEGRLCDANKAMARLLGYSEPEELLRKVDDIGRDVYAEPEQRREVMERLDREGTVSSLEFTAKHASGDKVWLSMEARAIRTAEGVVAYYEAMVSDITLRKKIEQELRAKQEKLHALLEYSPALISIKDAEGRYLLSSRMHSQVRSRGQSILGRRVDEVFTQEVAQGILAEDAQVLALGKPLTYQRPLPLNGELRDFVAIKFPLRDAAGRPDRVGTISYDVTDLERVREALRQSEEKFRIMIQTSPDLIWFIDPEGYLLEANSASRELIGYEPEELRGKHFSSFFHPEDLRSHDREQVLPHFLGAGDTPVSPPKLINERRQLPRSTRNLNLRLVPRRESKAEVASRSFELSSCGLWQDMRFMGTIVVIRDITERRSAEMELTRSQELLRQTQVMARIGGFSVNLDTREGGWTEEAGRLLGCEVQLNGACVGMPDFWSRLDFLAQEDRELFRAALLRAEELGESFDLELKLERGGGPQAWVRFMGRRADQDGARLLSGFIQDITERKELEQLKTDIDGIIRHDLKAPLNGIINLPVLMKNDGNLNDAQVELLQLIEDCGRTMLRQIDMSLDLMKIERGQYESRPAACDLAPLLREVTALLGDSARVKRVQVTVRLGGRPLAPEDRFIVWGEERLCHPMLVNLVQNALDASPPGERVEVELLQGECSRITIRNRGEVPVNIRDCFFEKYATSGKTGGTGLGTYSAQLFAEAQNGWVELNTDEPGFTSVIVRLPRP
ncbi:MAG TPA: PAS domain S-box protein [Humidesulfovibrio sp.]|nr:PAS domain S-box protein [Humidesulfovibrio sp.]